MFYLLKISLSVRALPLVQERTLDSKKAFLYLEELVYKEIVGAPLIESW